VTNWVPAEPADDEPRQVGDSLDRVTRSLGLPAARALNKVFAHWVDVVGEQVAAHARPLSLRRGRLLVGVDHPGWATQLRYLESDLIGRFAQVAGDGVVTAIDLRVTPT
jgi:predicted nucleic acid-binding Zn ribbon protein